MKNFSISEINVDILGTMAKILFYYSKLSEDKSFREERFNEIKEALQDNAAKLMAIYEEISGKDLKF